MRKSKQKNKDKLPHEFSSLEELQHFWDTHSLADHWDETEETSFEITPELRRKVELKKLYRLLGLDNEQIAAVEHRAEKEKTEVPRLLAKWVAEKIAPAQATATYPS